MRNAIFLSVSSEYFKYFHVFNKSLQENYPDYPNLIVLWQKLTSVQLDYLATIPRLHHIDVDTLEFEAGPAMLGREKEDPKIYYARFLIFSDLLKEYENILYLDTDIVILKPLDNLFERTTFTVFQEAYRGVNPIVNTEVNQVVLKKLFQRDDLPACPEIAANAGVFMAPRAVRNLENFKSLMSIKERYRDYLIWGDQSALNLWIMKKNLSMEVDFRFNFQPLLLDQKREWDAFKDIHIFHFNAMVRTPYLQLLMDMAITCWKIPVIGKWIYYCFHRFFFTQTKTRFPKLNRFLDWLDRRFGKW